MTTAVGAVALLRAFRGVPSGFLADASMSEATRDQARNLGGGVIGAWEWPSCPWGLGVGLRGPKSPHWAPVEATPGSFGRPGDTGCLVWADPVTDVTWAWLAMRVLDDWMVDASLPIKAELSGAT